MKKRTLLSLTACLLCACLYLGLAVPAWAADEEPEDWDRESEEEFLESQETVILEPEAACGEDYPEYEAEFPEEWENPEEEPWEPLIFLPDTVSLLPPEEGWQEESAFTLVSDWPCIAALSQDGGESWELLSPESGEEGWAFTAWELWEDSLLQIILLGDANLDGLVDREDQTILKGLLLSQTEPDELTLFCLDADRNGSLDMLDLLRLKAAVLGRQPLVWNADEMI